MLKRVKKEIMNGVEQCPEILTRVIRIQMLLLKYYFFHLTSFTKLELKLSVFIETSVKLSVDILSRGMTDSRRCCDGDMLELSFWNPVRIVRLQIFLIGETVEVRRLLPSCNFV
jgi:hypothetical protein